MCGKTMKNRIRNANIRDMVGIAPIEDKLRENRLRWFRRICCRPIDAVVRRSDIILDSDNTKGRGRPKLILDVVVKNDKIELNLGDHLALDWDKDLVWFYLLYSWLDP